MPRSLRATLAAASLGMLGEWACALSFPCDADEQCARDGTAGVCQPSGYCSFPDASCDSDQRYGELAPGELAGTCVPGAEGSGSDPTMGEGTTDGASTIVPGTTLPPDDTGTSGGSEDPSASDTDPPACCYAGCEGTCDSGGCSAQQIGRPIADAEAIGVAVMGEWVVWSTGFGRSLELATIFGDSMGQLVAVPSNSFVTKIAGDDTHVYFLDYGTGTVKRASVPEGVIDIVTVVPGGMADFGGIAVGDEHVYFTMRNTGDVWRGAKDLSQQGAAELVAEAANPHDVAIDDTTVYWIDDPQILRIRFDDIGTGEPEVVHEGGGLSTLTIDATHVYYAENGGIGRALKGANEQGVEQLAVDQGEIWDIAVDEAHVYWTASAFGALARVPLGGGEVEVLDDTPTPWGLDLGCHAAFWAENGTQTLQMVLK